MTRLILAAMTALQLASAPAQADPAPWRAYDSHCKAEWTFDGETYWEGYKSCMLRNEQAAARVQEMRDDHDRSDAFRRELKFCMDAAKVNDLVVAAFIHSCLRDGLDS